MILTKASKISATIGIFALLITMFLVSAAAAQEYCNCGAAVRPVSYYRAPVRRVARHRVRRSYYAARVRVRPVYRTVYVPETRVASYVGYNDTCNCDLNYTPTTSHVVVTEPVYTNTEYVTSRVYTSSYDMNSIARGWGRRDGFKDGWKAALKYRAYDPENNHDFRDANNGYRRRFGSKFLYKTTYRDGYVEGYDSGFRSVAGNANVTYGSIRY